LCVIIQIMKLYEYNHVRQDDLIVASEKGQFDENLMKATIFLYRFMLSVEQKDNT
jgi:hypothetical protein